MTYKIDKFIADEKIGRGTFNVDCLLRWLGEHKLRSADLAELLGVSYQAVISWRNRAKPNLPWLLPFALRYLEDHPEEIQRVKNKSNSNEIVLD